MRWWDGDKRCRVCGYASETIPHVLCHCMPHSAAMQLRHNAIAAPISKAAKVRGTLRENCRVEGVPEELQTLRPDIVARDEAAKRIIMVDVTVPFENGSGALDTARNAKLEKYRPLAEALRRQGYRVAVDAIVVGALGTWDPLNERVLKLLNINKFYASLMRRLIVSETIHWSRDIYVEHVSGTRQYGHIS
ncbi:hypothetical protein ACLKA7_011399 [Drosophila subpalustris]